MQVKLITTERELAEKLMLPIQNEIITFRDNDSDAGSLEWGDVEIERGAVETIFEILGSLQLGSILVGVVSEIIANWLWSHLQKSHPQKPNDIQVEIIVAHDDATRIVRIECDSLEAMKASLSSALEVQKNEQLEPRNGSN